MVKPIGKVDAIFDKEIGAIVFKCPKCGRPHPAVAIIPRAQFVDVVLLPCTEESTTTIRLTLRRDQFDVFLKSKNLVWTPYGILETGEVAG